MWNKKNNTAKGKGAFEFDLSANRMSAFSAVKAQKSEPSNIAKGALGLCAFLTSVTISKPESLCDTLDPSSIAFDPTDPIFGKFADYGNPIE